jgi:hypothetical protein
MPTPAASFTLQDVARLQSIAKSTPIDVRQGRVEGWQVATLENGIVADLQKHECSFSSIVSDITKFVGIQVGTDQSKCERAKGPLYNALDAADALDSGVQDFIVTPQALSELERLTRRGQNAR